MGYPVVLFGLVRGRRQAHNPTLAKILRLTYNRNRSHNRTQTAACNAVYSISRRALLITRLGEQLPRPRQVSMIVTCGCLVKLLTQVFRKLWDSCVISCGVVETTSNTRRMCAIPRSLARGHDESCDPRHGTKISLILKGVSDPRIRD